MVVGGKDVDVKDQTTFTTKASGQINLMSGFKCMMGK